MEMNLVKTLGRLVQWRGARLSILIFHRVLAAPDPLFPEEPDAIRFESILRSLRGGFEMLRLFDAVQALREGSLRPNSLAITFDDGYADNQQIAAPILARLGLHATFFVADGFLDGGRMWNDTVIEALRHTSLPALDLSDLGLDVHELATTADRRRAIDRLLPAIKYLPTTERQRRVEEIAKRCGARLPNDLMMTTSQLQDLHRSGMAIGGHTVNHPILCSVADDEARREIARNKHRLEELLQAPVNLFAYPNGKPDKDYRARHAAMVRDAGYRAAVTTAPGVARCGADPMQLPRFTPWDRQALRFGLRLVGNMRQAVRLAA